ncbi:hypothetical protein B296_00040488 [Ensete ventricosum]|uniref:Longin domain-containing protein n=1 Tax=Ensete ventricosum TaxID=4639 RepID=A0A426YTX1_ENSVE|nr:hypothetical protein B296_00040488 [Ensete ventricosum]
MAILYAVVARGTSVLAEFAAMTGNVGAVARRILEKLPPDSDSRLCFSQDRYIFHVLRSDGITFLCMANDTFGKAASFHHFRPRAKAAIDSRMQKLLQTPTHLSLRHFRLLYRGLYLRKAAKAPISSRSTTATPNPPRQQLRPRQTLLGSRLSIKAGDPKSDLLLLHGAIGNRGPPPTTIARARPNQCCRGPNPLCCFPLFRSDSDQIWCYSSTISFHLLPFAATSSEPSSGSIAAHLLPPTATDPASAAASKPRSHRLFSSQRLPLQEASCDNCTTLYSRSLTITLNSSPFL